MYPGRTQRFVVVSCPLIKLILFKATLAPLAQSWYCLGATDTMMTSSNGNIFRVTGHLCGEFTGPRWIPHIKGQWRGALMFTLICVRINGCVNNREAGDLRRYYAHYGVTVMQSCRICANKSHTSILNIIKSKQNKTSLWTDLKSK